MKKNKRKKVQGNPMQIAIARDIIYAGRKMTQVKSFLGIWYWFFVLD